PQYKEFIINQLDMFNKNKNLAKTLNNEISNRWDFLENYQPSKTLKSYIPNTNLIQTSWNQDYPYNKYLPKFEDGNYTVAGCVQVATSQLMKYYNYPSKGKGVVSNPQSNNNVIDMKAVLNKYYNWSTMPNSLDGASEYQIDEIAYLMRDLVVANEASFDKDGTSAYNVTEALIANYGYSTSAKHLQSDSNYAEYASNSEIVNIVKSQIDLEQPVLFGLPGHLVIADGYQNDNTGNYVHLNMGWGGSSDTYYNIGETIIADPYTFGTTYDIWYDVKPCDINISGDCNLVENNNLSIDVAPVIDSSLDEQILTSSKKIFINGYDENNEDNISFKSFQNNNNIELSFNNNILTIKPLVQQGSSKVKVELSSNDKSIYKEFNVLINDEVTHFGKEFSVNGTFLNQDDLYKHKVILEGSCSVSGFNGYSNQPFYTSLLDTNENILSEPINDTFNTDTLITDFYLIGSSLSSSKQYYLYDENDANYTLNISCPQADITTSKLSKILDIAIDESDYITEDTNSSDIVENSIVSDVISWNLMGAVEDTNVSNISCKDMELKSIWKYTDNSWKLYTIIPNSTSYETFDIINKGEGFWVNCENE
ncbi:MAG: C10 family peptidase, partial [Campylobacterota bacterium]|nr:C10 family peptidase [Campylobacterota bacterium]